MIETQVRELFMEIAAAEPAPSRVDTRLAHHRGRARLRWRRARVAGTPALAAAAVVAVALAVGVGPLRPAPGPAAGGTGPAAPRLFSPLVPYVSFGWLPAGISLTEGGTRRTAVWLNAGRSFDDPLGWSLSVYAAGQCRLTAAARELRCSTQALEGLRDHILGRAPAVRGHRAFWTRSYLVWQYARGGWAWLMMPLPPRGPQHRPAVQREAVKIAGHVRYGAVTPPLLFPAQLTHLPRPWQVRSVTYLPDHGVLRARSYTLGTGTPDLGADGSLDFQSGLPSFTIDPATPRNSSCYAWPGRSAHETINGHRVVVNHLPAGKLQKYQLCAGNADGLSVFIIELGSRTPSIGVASVFGRMRLLGANPAKWTTKPIG